MVALTSAFTQLRAYDSNGEPVSGALLRIYEAGTSTAVTVYADSALATPHSPYPAANSAGVFPACYVPGGVYKIDMQTSTGSSLPGYPLDNVGVYNAEELNLAILRKLSYLDAAGASMMGGQEGAIQDWHHGAKPARTALLNSSGYANIPTWAGTATWRDFLSIGKEYITVSAFMADDGIGDRITAVRVAGVLLYRDATNGTVIQNNGDTWAMPRPGQFETRAQAISFASAIKANSGNAADGDVLIWGGRRAIVFKTVATVISDAAGWEPLGGCVYMDHFGIEGESAGNPFTSNQAKATVDVGASTIQAGMDWALANGKDFEGDISKVYGISAQLVWGARVASPTIVGYPTLRNLRLTVLSGGSWTAGTLTDPNPNNWTYGDAALILGKTSAYTSNKVRLGAENVFVDGNRIAPVGIWYRGASQRFNQNVHAIECTEAHILVGDMTTGQHCTGSVFVNCGAREFDTTADPADGYNDYSVRTAAGIVIRSADTRWFAPTSSSCKYALILGDCSNFQCHGGQLWNGEARTDAASRTVWIAKAANNFRFTGTRIDDGATYLESFDGGFIGCDLIQYSGGNSLELVASAANEKAEKFKFIGNAMNDAAAALLTTGSGSWGRFRAKFSGNSTGSGEAFTFGGLCAGDGEHAMAEVCAVADLPSATFAGENARGMVTDASATTFLSTVAGGGANKVPVVCDGTNWLIG